VIGFFVISESLKTFSPYRYRSERNVKRPPLRIGWRYIVSFCSGTSETGSRANPGRESGMDGIGYMQARMMAVCGGYHGDGGELTLPAFPLSLYVCLSVWRRHHRHTSNKEQGNRTLTASEAAGPRASEAQFQGVIGFTGHE